MSGAHASSSRHNAPDEPSLGRVRAVTPDELNRISRTSSLPVLVAHWAPWARPCAQMSPLLDEVAREWDGRTHVLSVDVAAHPGAARAADVTRIPTVILFVGGHEVVRHVGACPKHDLIDLLLAGGASSSTRTPPHTGAPRPPAA